MSTAIPSTEDDRSGARRGASAWIYVGIGLCAGALVLALLTVKPPSDKTFPYGTVHVSTGAPTADGRSRSSRTGST